MEGQFRKKFKRPITSSLGLSRSGSITKRLPNKRVPTSKSRRTKDHRILHQRNRRPRHKIPFLKKRSLNPERELKLHLRRCFWTLSLRQPQRKKYRASDWQKPRWHLLTKKATAFGCLRESFLHASCLVSSCFPVAGKTIHELGVGYSFTVAECLGKKRPPEMPLSTVGIP